MIIEFGEWLPDLSALNNPGSFVVKNVIPCGTSYEQLKSLVSYSDALDAYARAMIMARDPSSGASFNFAGNGTKLYLLANGLWSNVSKAGNYALGTDDSWFFTQFGTKILATAITQPIQAYTIGVSALFVDLASTGMQAAPLARYISTVRDFVVVANTFDSIDGFVPNRVRWAGIGSSTLWQVDPSTQADFQDLDAQYGWCTQIIGGEYGVIFQERAITRMDYIGSPAVFQFNTIEVNQGTQYSKSIVRVGSNIYYLGIDGFKVFDGTRSTPIGTNKVDKTFFRDFDSSFPHRISVGVDYNNNLICWAYPGIANTGGNPNRIIFYNFSPNAQKRWTFADIQLELIGDGFSEGYTLDGLDVYQTNVQHVAPNIDILPFSLDSRVWTGNNLLLSAFDTTHKLAAFTGAALDAIIETPEVQLSEGQRTNVQLVKPAIDGAAGVVDVQIGTRNLLSEGISYSSPVVLDSTGNCQVRSNARYHRMRVNVAGGFSHALGFEILEMRKAGKR